MPDYSPRRDFIRALAACVALIAFAVPAAAMFASIFEGYRP